MQLLSTLQDGNSNHFYLSYTMIIVAMIIVIVKTVKSMHNSVSMALIFDHDKY